MQIRFIFGLPAAVGLLVLSGKTEYLVLVASVLNVFLCLSVQLKAECNKGYVRVKQVCVSVAWMPIYYSMVFLCCCFRVCQLVM